ncbi:hypothetical protein IVA88_14970 [Bradyrhizobium sp. 149]|uniref:hypothetical protein n=1 Tax=Bradyrhizobium sp. 149 TaxID=2782624 RepID=UPI001FFC09EA|nr:hypothetical protein [Bradyrhizobium sp. 149]MCK1652731.1 hypothetical protein [Bradyrhizobium sp. 149]
MRDRFGLKWLIKCAAAAALALVICAAAKPFLPSGMQAPATTARDGALIALNRYVSEPAPKVVLLGSSLTARMREDYFDHLNVRNLAIGGGSPLTGLRFLLLDRQKLPKTILIESNLLSKGADEKLIESYSSPKNKKDLFFRPVRMGVAAYENWQHAPRNREESVTAANRLLTEAAQQYNNQLYFDRAAEGFDQDLTAALRNNVDELARLISTTQSEGILVLFFELPYADQLEHTRLVRDTRRFALDRFDNSKNWLNLTLAKHDLRWPDGMHMDERSAILAARAIEQAVIDLSKTSAVGLSK